MLKVGQQSHFGSKQCPVSGLKRQCDKLRCFTCPLPPPSHKTHRYTLSHLILSLKFEVSQGVTRYLLLKVAALLQPREGRGRGYRSSSCSLEGVPLQGYCTFSIANRGLIWATKRIRHCFTLCSLHRVASLKVQKAHPAALKKVWSTAKMTAKPSVPP